MSWIQKLYETYDCCSAEIGNQGAGRVPLLPIAHTTQKAQLEIVIDASGNFRRAQAVGKDDARTVIPCTEDSANRTSGESAHPLADKLQYVAQDYSGYVGEKNAYFDGYHKQLMLWCESRFSHWKACAVLKYVEKGTVIRDLVNEKVLFVGEGNKLLNKWDKANGDKAPPIFSVITQSQAECFVRWRVEKTGERDSTTWADSSLQQSWTDYYASTRQGNALCFVTGEECLPAVKHPAKIRNDADKAKMISSNDSSGFTYRGRFISPSDVCAVSYEVTNKAHNALRWLIGRQGSHFDTKAIVAWATSGEEIPDALADTYSFGGQADPDEEGSPAIGEVYTADQVAERFNQRMKGYASHIGGTTDVVVMSVDAATTGRLSITYYQELSGSDYLRNIDRWHKTCAWKHSYVTLHDKSRKKDTKVEFIGAPAPRDIAEAAYGLRVDAKLKAATVERLLPCIVGGKPLPGDLMLAVVNRAVMRAGREDWEWNKSLSIACALYKKYYQEEDYQMALDENRNSRDYLYGRLLAIADVLEGWALSEMNEKRQTNAARFTQKFADHPFGTWKHIWLSLEPYKARLGPQKCKRFTDAEQQVMGLFKPEEYLNDRALSGEFLLGYYCQREALYKSNKKDAENI